jgi:DNA helicase HerA-like ATPase
MTAKLAQPAPKTVGPEIVEFEKIGYAIAVEGSRVVGVLEGDAAAVRPGSFVKITCDSASIFGIVAATRIRPGSGTPLASASVGTMDIELIGEIGADARFQRGVSRYPALGAAIAAASRDDLARIYAPPSVASVVLGTLSNDPERPAYVRTDDLLGKHFAVLGTTGSGKSCAVTLILKRILKEHPHGHVVLLDPHNEYAKAFGAQAEVVNLTDLSLPYWLLNFSEALAAFVAADGPTQDFEAAILREAILEARRDSVLWKGKRNDAITVDSPIPYDLDDVMTMIDKRKGRLSQPEGAVPYLRLENRIAALRTDERLKFMFAPATAMMSLTDILSRILRIPVAGRPLTIVDLSGVPSEIIDVVVSVISRMMFDFAVWSMGQATAPLLLVCEEAHRYVSSDERSDFAPSRMALSRIASEGRKYGVSLGLISHRPSQLSATILSHCNTLFALRMSNAHDQEYVRRAMPEGWAALVAELPALRSQEAVVVGEGVATPMRLRFGDLDPSEQPRSQTAPFAALWAEDALDRAFIEDTVHRWRHQTR